MLIMIGSCLRGWPGHRASGRTPVSRRAEARPGPGQSPKSLTVRPGARRPRASRRSEGASKDGPAGAKRGRKRGLEYPSRPFALAKGASAMRSVAKDADVNDLGSRPAAMTRLSFRAINSSRYGGDSGRRASRPQAEIHVEDNAGPLSDNARRSPEIRSLSGSRRRPALRRHCRGSKARGNWWG